MIEDGLDVKDAVHFLFSFLSILRCQQIKIRQETNNVDLIFICGFKSDSIQTLEVILALFPQCQINSELDNYIIRLPVNAVEEIFRAFLRQVLAAHFYEYNVTDHQFDVVNYECHLTEETYSAVRSQLDPLNLYKVGLDLREKSIAIYDGSFQGEFAGYQVSQAFMMENLQRARLSSLKTIHYVCVNGYSSYRTFILASQTLQRIMLEVRNKENRNVFVHVFHFQCKNSRLLDKNILTDIFELAKIEKNSDLSNNVLVFEDAGEQKNDDFSLRENVDQENEQLREIQNRIDELASEGGCCFLNFNSARKMKKIKFLNLVVSYHEVNSNFSLKKCVDLVKQDYPELYKSAIAGEYSLRTKELLDTISECSSGELTFKNTL